MKMDVNQIKEALLMLERTNGIREETALEALKDGIVKAYKKEIGIDEVQVELVFDLDKGIIELYRLYAVVREVEDEYLEISIEDANKNKEGKTYSLGDYYPVEANLNELRSATLRSIKAIFSQKIKEVEKGNLYEAFKDKIGTMITGKVETVDERGASINVGNVSIFLPRREMIGDEKFVSGQTIKLYVNKVDNTKKLQIDISRACPGFLEALFKEEIPDIYNGNIVIKKIARQAGERSKVAVYSDDPNVDPAGACIGPNGSRVQKIVSNLGMGDNKEKVDVIQYYEQPILFIAEALKPAHVAGIMMDEDESVKECTVIVRDDSLSLAIGKKGVNVRLAANLTGYKIDILTETEAAEEEFTYTTIEELQAMATSLKADKISALQQEELQRISEQQANGVLPGLPEGYVAPQERVYENEAPTDLDKALEEASEDEEIQVDAPVVEEAPQVEAKEEKKEEAPVEEKKVETIKTSTTLSDLEASLEADSKKKENNSRKSTKKKKENNTEEEESTSAYTPTGQNMSIYTEEELKAFEEEEEQDDSYDDEEVDYDDYDDYYDDDDR